jgi:hypothetical protein
MASKVDLSPVSVLSFPFQNSSYLRHVSLVKDGVPDSAKFLDVVQGQQKHLLFDRAHFMNPVSNYACIKD